METRFNNLSSLEGKALHVHNALMSDDKIETAIA